MKTVRSVRICFLVCVSLGLGGCASDPAPVYVPDAKLSRHLLDAVASNTRRDEDRARDAYRRPAEVLAFFQVEPGMKIADLMGSAGYYSAILGRAVGPQGKVYLQNNKRVRNLFGNRGFEGRQAKGDLPNVARWDRELEDLGFETGELDVALLILFYHDTYWMGVDRAKMNAEVFRSLRPGGVYGIIDHFAKDGSRERYVESLHRGDAEQIKAEILAAGFILEAESDLLRHPEDDRTKNVFRRGMRGRTDRFVYRFRKPTGSR